MPEGPEIRQAADKVAAVLESEVVLRASFSPHKLRHYGPRLSGHAVNKIDTRGKAMLTHFDNGLTIYSHNQLYGVWKVVLAGVLPKTNRSLRLALHTENHSALLYSASDISVWHTSELSNHPFLSQLGPDILDERATVGSVARRLMHKPFKNRTLHSILLDQKFMAGVGNYLRSEILFSARVSPELRPRELSASTINLLASEILNISRRSYVSKGITLCPEFLAKLNKKKSPGTRQRFYVFGREGKPCRVCEDVIQRKDSSGRRIYWCRNCQNGDGHVESL